MSRQKLGKLSKEPDGYRVVFERIFPHSPKTVWEAITDPKKLAVWFMDVEMDLVPGARMIIQFRDAARTVTYGKIIRLESGRLFEYIWENTDGPDELATWEIFPVEPSGSRLVLTYSRFAGKYVKSVPMGWHILLDQLEETLNGRQEPFPETTGDTEDQKILQKKYQKVLEKVNYKS